MADVAPVFAEALALHKAGQLADAEKIYNRIIAAQPKHFDSLHLLGVIFLQRGDPAAAVRQIGDALKVTPHHILALNNRGNAFQQLQRFGDALSSYDRALSVRPDYVEALTNRGVTLNALGRYDEALASHDRAIAIRADFAEAHSNRGNVLSALNRFEEALASFDRAIALRPDYADAYYNRGNTLHELDRFEEALASHDRALAARPDYTDALTNRGATLHALKRYDEALASLNRSLALNPDNADALINRGATLNAVRRFDEALIDYERALALAPDNAEAHLNRGVSLHDTGRFEEALASYDCVLMQRPDDAEALTNRGASLHGLGRFDEALASYHRALTFEPDYGQAHFNESLCRLVQGDFGGFAKYEWRWETDQLKDGKRNFAQPTWTGAIDLAGKTILLHAEQGFGDTIQFCRYTPLVAQRAARVILEVPEPFRELAASLPGGAQVVARGETLPDFDVHCPLLSLPFVLGTELSTLPSQVPYLHAPPQSVALWNDRLGAKNRPRIGIAWSGNRAYENDRNRSVALRALLPILGRDATYVSVQKDIEPDDANFLQDRTIPHFGDELRNFADTAALISNLDLVISVDTGVAHLAGALAKPVWILLPFVPDWRWMLDRDDSPWYPTARLFRQDESRAWESVIARVDGALRQRLAT